MDLADFHYYEPSKGHGLRHNPFNAIVAPRPIGWISSRNAAGQLNLAPYSFFNAFLYDPPIIGFSSISWKDTVKNVSETREFVWNLVTMDLGERMNATAKPLDHGGLNLSRFTSSYVIAAFMIVCILLTSRKTGDDDGSPPVGARTDTQ